MIGKSLVYKIVDFTYSMNISILDNKEIKMNIKDIAKLAGVSVSTVSKVVNKKDQSISQKTREKVLKIVKEYNYTSYSSGIQKSTSTGILGILINTSITDTSTLNGIIYGAQSGGYSPLVLHSYDDLEQEFKNISKLISKNVDGIIWLPVQKENVDNQHYLMSSGIPTISLGNHLDEHSYCLPYESAASFLTKQLIHFNHEKIACLVDDITTDAAFIKGYKTALFENQLSFQENMIFSKLDNHITDLIINGQITGIVSSRFYHSINLQRLTANSQLNAPKHYSLVSLRNDNENQIYTYENVLSTLTLNNFEFGKYLSTVLLNKIADIELANYHQQTFELDNFNTLGHPYDYSKPKILVIGSMNMDTYLYSPKLPYKGTPTFLSSSTKSPGGKGFNQALGISNLGEDINLIGCLGTDMNSNIIFQELEKKEIATHGIIRSDNTESGQAYIFVESSGDSIISILPGANSELSPQKIQEKKSLFSEAKLCLIQTEIPIETVDSACSIAKEMNIKTILKPSTSACIPDSILEKTDFFIPNENELNYLCPHLDTLEEKANYFLEKGVQYVIVTLGKKGCFFKTIHIEKYFTASDFTPIDTTGASDAFISAFGSYLLKGYSIEKAIQIATIAAGFSVSRDGVMTSLVDNDTLVNYIAKKNPLLLSKA